MCLQASDCITLGSKVTAKALVKRPSVEADSSKPFFVSSVLAEACAPQAVVGTYPTFVYIASEAGELDRKRIPLYL